eukprot:Opistho-2@60149
MSHTATITRSFFDGVSSDTAAGFASVRNFATLTMSETVVQSASALLDGGVFGLGTSLVYVDVPVTETNITRVVGLQAGGVNVTDSTFLGASVNGLLILEDFVFGGNGGFTSMEDESVLRLTNCTVSDIFAAQRGGVVFAGSQALFVATASTFERARADKVGGSLVSLESRSVVLMDQCVARDLSTGGPSGGAFSVTKKASARVTRSSFSLVYADAGDGGFASISDDAFMSITDGSTVTFARSKLSGGVFRLSGRATALVTNATFSVGTAEVGFGGFASLSESANLSLLGVAVTNVSALAGGGFLRISDEAHVDIANTSITGARALAGVGGLVQLEGTASLRATRMIVSNAFAARKGGAFVSVGSSTATFASSLFYNCTSQREGGGFGHLSDGATVEMNACTVQDVSALDSGGAFDVRDGSSLAVLGSRFTGLRTTGRGGFLNLADRVSVVVKSTVCEDSAASDPGGALSLTGSSSASVEMCTFRRSRSGASGGFSDVQDDASLSVSHSHVDQVMAELSGGSISVKGRGYVGITETSFVGSESLRGNGGFACAREGSRVVAVNVNVTSASAGQKDDQLAGAGSGCGSSDGGALFVGDRASAHFVGALITNSTSSGSGGCVAVGAGEANVTMASCTVAHSAAFRGGAVYVGSMSRVSMHESVVRGASALGDGGCIFSDADGVATMADVALEDCLAGGQADLFGAGGAIYLGPGAYLKLEGASTAQGLRAARGPAIFSVTPINDTDVALLTVSDFASVFVSPPLAEEWEAGGALSGVAAHVRYADADVHVEGPGKIVPSLRLSVFDYYGNPVSLPGNAPLSFALHAIWPTTTCAVSDPYCERACITNSPTSNTNTNTNTNINTITNQADCPIPCDGETCAILGSVEGDFGASSFTTMRAFFRFCAAGNVQSARRVQESLSVRPTRFVAGSQGPTKQDAPHADRRSVSLRICPGCARLAEAVRVPHRYPQLLCWIRRVIRPCLGARTCCAFVRRSRCGGGGTCRHITSPSTRNGRAGGACGVY